MTTGNDYETDANVPAVLSVLPAVAVTVLVSAALTGIGIWQTLVTNGEFKIGMLFWASWILPLVAYVVCRFGLRSYVAVTIAASVWFGTGIAQLLGNEENPSLTTVVQTIFEASIPVTLVVGAALLSVRHHRAGRRKRAKRR